VKKKEGDQQGGFLSTQTPKIDRFAVPNALGFFGMNFRQFLEAKSITDFGAFMDWGLAEGFTGTKKPKLGKNNGGRRKIPKSKSV